MRSSFSVFVAVVGISALAGCGGTTNSLAGKSAQASTVESPQFSPAPGTYSTAQSVTLTDRTPGAIIYYTTDGTQPSTSSPQYAGPLTVSGSEVIQAIAATPQAAPSAVMVGAYSIVAPVVSVTAAAFDFGEDLVNNVITKTVATVTNGGPAPSNVTVAVAGDPSFSVVTAQSCAAQVPANGSCPVVVAYDPTKAGLNTGTLQVQFPGGSAPATTVSMQGTAAAVTPGTVTATNNPQVASYSITPPFGGSVAVQFGTTTNYGFNTSAQATPTSDGGPVNILVAGMLANTVYHMQATVTLENGTTYQDSDHTFTTGAVPAGVVPAITVTQTPGLTPQPGIELIDSVIGGVKSGAVATDLAGNVIWTYSPPDIQPGVLLYPVKLLANGHMISAVAPGTGAFAPPYPGVPDCLREYDLAGNTVRELSIGQLNSRLNAAGFTGLNLIVFHHEVTTLPNGHTLVLTNTAQQSTLTGVTGTTNVLGDVIIDLDPDWNPVWIWNEFDHFDVNRHPMGFPDWTHTNAIVYSPDDGNILVSIRHQNWIVKVNYNNGAGDGSVIWKLGYQGDFTLQGGTAPQDWFYAQHNPAFFSANTTGVFSLGVMDNGDDRQFADGTNCLTQGGASCYTTIPVMQVDENAKTATLTFHQVIPTDMYSSFAGSVDLLSNNNIEYNLAGVNAPGGDAYIFEVTPTATPQTVWEMQITGTNTYRAFRIPSLYPGVSW